MSISYISVLKWKRGEQSALSNLDPLVKKKILPVTCLMSNDIDSIVRSYKKHWPDQSFILDFHSKSKITDAEKIKALDEFEKAGLSFIPMINPSTSIPIIKKANSFKRGATVRIDAALDYSTVVEPFFDSCEISVKDLDIIIDAPWLNKMRDNIPLATKHVKSMLDDCQKYVQKKQKNFRKLIFAGSSFPEMLSKLAPYSVTSIERIEWSIWKGLRKHHKELLFGDYGVDDPKEIEPGKGLTIIPTLRYTHQDQWFIIRGEMNRENKYDYPQFHKLCQLLIKQPFYCGPTYSWGDEKIKACADQPCTDINCNHGNLEKWVKVALNHHMTYVSHQVANLP